MMLLAIIVLAAIGNMELVEKDVTTVHDLSMWILFAGSIVIGGGLTVIGADKLAAWISGRSGQSRKTDSAEIVGMQS